MDHGYAILLSHLVLHRGLSILLHLKYLKKTPEVSDEREWRRSSLKLCVGCITVNVIRKNVFSIHILVVYVHSTGSGVRIHTVGRITDLTGVHICCNVWRRKL
ncbi:uncharacterized protein LOC100193212 [Zea mays]|jgi:hypothetical protein|uniref:Uncharacterized protein n=1 Tax=Zea mays TaxID=4577 RepID=B4FE80_MAIZE|nr:uncharacterized protein LOC100193212 [Zea mays]ACF80423.1 unknown [Zea mays]ACG45272.1 hypothetical protein [Zea mays]|eukprot:NP_001131837.1 uncharacterized protein LOC100193212 [Zea mays]